MKRAKNIVPKSRDAETKDYWREYCFQLSLAQFNAFISFNKSHITLLTGASIAIAAFFLEKGNERTAVETVTMLLALEALFLGAVAGYLYGKYSYHSYGQLRDEAIENKKPNFPNHLYYTGAFLLLAGFIHILVGALYYSNQVEWLKEAKLFHLSTLALSVSSVVALTAKIITCVVKMRRKL